MRLLVSIRLPQFKNMEAIILDGEQKSALAVVRSLGKHGISCTVGSTRKMGMALHSRYTTGCFVYDSPFEAPEKFIEQVISECASKKEKPVLFAMSDAASLLLARHREKLLPHAHLLLPSFESIEIAYDKARTVGLATYCQVPTPKTYTPASTQEVGELVPTLTFPVVVKPRHSTSWVDGVGARGIVVFAHNSKELLEHFVRIVEEAGEPPIIQEYVRGEEFGVEVFALKGKVRALCAHRRIRSLSPRGGAAVVKETISVSSDVKGYVEKLIKELSWDGVAMIEFKRDKERGGRELLIEINGRFWGSLPLAVAAGVDFPHLHFKASQGEEVASEFFCKVPTVSRHFLGDVKHLLSVLFARDPLRSQLYPSRGHAIRDFFKFTPHMHYDVISWRDPKPFMFEIINRLV